MFKQLDWKSEVKVLVKTNKPLDSVQQGEVVLRLEQALNSLPPFKILLEDDGLLADVYPRFCFVEEEIV